MQRYVEALRKVSQGQHKKACTDLCVGYLAYTYDEIGKRLLRGYDDILNVKEFAQDLGCCTNTMYNMLIKRKIRAKRIGRDWVISKETR